MDHASQIRAVFFDIGDTLGSVHVSGDPPVVELKVYPYVPRVLKELRAEGLRLGVISNTRASDSAASMRRVLESGGIYPALDADILLYSSVEGVDKSKCEIFRRAADRVGHQPEQCLFVGEDSDERRVALGVGMRVSPHPLLALDVAAGAVLRYARLTLPAQVPESNWRATLSKMRVIPLRVSGDGGTEIIAIVSGSAVPRIANALFGLQLLGEANAPLASDLYLLRDDRAVRTGFLTDDGQAARMFSDEPSVSWLLGSSSQGLLVALPAGRTIEDYHFSEAQRGHNEKLVPDVGLLAPFGPVA